MAGVVGIQIEDNKCNEGFKYGVIKRSLGITNTPWPELMSQAEKKKKKP